MVLPLRFSNPPASAFSVNAFAAFLTGGQHKDQVPIRFEILLPQSQHRGAERRHAVFVIGGAAAIKIAVLLGGRGIIKRKIFAFGFDNIEMGHQNDRRFLAAAMVTDDQIFVLRLGTDDLDVGIGETGVTESACELAANAAMRKTVTLFMVRPERMRPEDEEVNSEPSAGLLLVESVAGATH